MLEYRIDTADIQKYRSPFVSIPKNTEQKSIDIYRIFSRIDKQR